MKAPTHWLRDLLWLCVSIIVLNAILFQVIQRTEIIEKLMASTFTGWELVVIVAFIITRLTVYLAVPSLLAGLIIYALSKRWMGGI